MADFGIRLALRHEGELWNAYAALPNTMDGAVLLGSIVIGAVSGPEGQDRKRAFMDLMANTMAIGIEAATGQVPTWGLPEDAPQHERSGHG
jgi:hypothetical protein